MVTYSQHSFKAMGSSITVNADIENPQPVFTKIQELFNTVEQQASRFIEDNPLQLLNNNPQKQQTTHK